MIHNGIIENYAELREELKKEGHRFISETDTEVLPHLLEKYNDKDLLSAMQKLLKKKRNFFKLCKILLKG